MSNTIAKFTLLKQRIVAVAPVSITNLNEGASSEALTLLRQAVPIAPALLFDLLALHNGEGGYAWTSMFPDGMQLMAIDHIIENSLYYQRNGAKLIENLEDLISESIMERPCGAVKPIFSYAQRVPFAHYNNELIWYFDMDPAEGGKVAQIVYEDAECSTLRVVAESFCDLLNKYLRDLDVGVLFPEEYTGQIRSSSGNWYADPDNILHPK